MVPPVLRAAPLSVRPIHPARLLLEAQATKVRDNAPSFQEGGGIDAKGRSGSTIGSRVSCRVGSRGRGGRGGGTRRVRAMGGIRGGSGWAAAGAGEPYSCGVRKKGEKDAARAVPRVQPGFTVSSIFGKLGSMQSPRFIVTRAIERTQS